MIVATRPVVADVHTHRCVLDQVEAIRDALLVEVGVRCEREQAGHLVLPAEAADAGGGVTRRRRLEDRNFDHESAHAGRLIIRNVSQRLIVNHFHETVAERVQRGPERAHIGVGRHALLDAGIQGAVVDERSAVGCHKSMAIEAARAQFSNLTDTAGHRSLVTLGA